MCNWNPKEKFLVNSLSISISDDLNKKFLTLKKRPDFSFMGNQQVDTGFTHKKSKL